MTFMAIWWLAARVLLYAPSHRQGITCHNHCYTSCGALAGRRTSSIAQWGIIPTMSGCSIILLHIVMNGSGNGDEIVMRLGFFCFFLFFGGLLLFFFFCVCFCISLCIWCNGVYMFTAVYICSVCGWVCLWMCVVFVYMCVFKYIVSVYEDSCSCMLDYIVCIYL